MGTEKEVHEILRLLRLVSMNIKRRMLCGASGMGYSMPQFMIMHELTKVAEITMHDLQDKCGLPKSTLSRTVDQLVRRGLLKRVRPENNRRVVLLSIAPSYAREKAKLKETVAAELSKGLNTASARSIKNSLNTLNKLLTN